jgi:hypothetical protein
VLMKMEWVVLMAYLSIAGLAASSDVGTASLLDGNGDCEGLIVSQIVLRSDRRLECQEV